ncbi:MAG: hypothetical protein JWM02_2294 [Frankiales bacterium]|nr:hypothetical protein [Frankiales bacterium]
MRTYTKLFGMIAAAGLVAAGGSAFTGAGLSTTGSAASAQYVGGTVSQSVTGGTLASVAYGFTDATNTAVNQVTLTFADTNTAGKTPTITLAGGSPVTFTCAQITAGTGTTSVCDPTPGDSQTGVTGISVTV